MTTPTPNPHGLPTRCKAWDRMQEGTAEKREHWSYDPSRKLRGKAFRVSARLLRLRAML